MTTNRDLEITFTERDQILGMGGPILGDLHISGILVARNIVKDSWITDCDKSRIYMIKYSNKSRWMVRNFFSIWFYDSLNTRLYKLKGKYRQLFLDSISSNTIRYHESLFPSPLPTKTLNVETVGVSEVEIS